jgi:hypothetical protein
MAFNQFPQKGGIPSGNTAGRPSNPIIGDTYYNGTLEILEIYNGTAWVANSAPPAVPSVVSVTDVGTGLAYTSGGTFTVVVEAGSGGATALQYNALTTAGGFSATSSSTTISMTGLTPATTFSVVANAQNNFGTTINSNPFASTLATTKPQVPTIGTASTSGVTTNVTVTWTLGSDGGKNLSAITITPYLNGTTAQTAQTAATTSSTTHTFTGLTGGSAYTFKVKTTNANGDSPESSATNSVTIPILVVVDYLVIAGGGGGSHAGAGGAGGYRTSAGTSGGNSSAESSLSLLLSTNYTVTVGGGGAGGTSGTMASGVNSVFSTITSDGGGGGAYAGGGANGAAGGSGGGSGASNGGGARAGGTATANQGSNGGAYSGSGDCGSGGGGAGATGGANSGNTAGNGGDGLSSNITGSAVTRGGGGGGSSAVGGVGSGGSGGGGAGGSNTGSTGTVNTGGGGGAGWGTTGAAGNSGVVILRYPDTRTITIGAGLTGTESSASGGFKRATLTAGSGNVSWA